MMEYLIKEILQKHGIQDEKLTAALVEISEVIVEETKSQLALETSSDLRLSGHKS